MIRYYFTIGVFLIYSYSTNATATFNPNTGEIRNRLRKEANFVGSISKLFSSKKRRGIVCDQLTGYEKQLICAEMRYNLVGEQCGRSQSFKYSESTLEPPAIAGSGDPLKCRVVPIEALNMSRRMFWCWPKRFVGVQWPSYNGHAQGFFIASGRKLGRVYAFRPENINSPNVRPVGQLDNVEIILERAHRLGL